VSAANSERGRAPVAATAGADVEDALLATIHDVFTNRIPFNKVLGLDIVSLAADRPVLRFPMRPELVGNYVQGILHGGVTSAVLDVTGGIVAFLGLHRKLAGLPLAERIDRYAKVGTIDLRIDYLRPGKGAYFTATGYALRAGNKVAVARMELHDDREELVAVGTGAYLIG
jgi:uncharacterized protein (TIGR00369 family)